MKIIKSLSGIFNRNSTGELKHVTDALDQPISTLAKDVKLLDLQYVIATSTGEWLDEWGTWFGVPRKSGELDEDYSIRMLSMATKPKNTIPSIIQAIRDALKDQNAIVNIYEPYQDIFRFNISELSGTHKIQDSVYTRHAVIDIHINSPLPENLVELIEAIKSAGVKVYFTRVNQLGDGTIIRMYSDTQPKYLGEIETQMSTREVNLHVVGATLLGSALELVSGRKLTFTDGFLEYELGKVRIGRTAAHSRTLTIYPGESIPIEIMDDYFNSVSYERERELGKVVMLNEVLVDTTVTKITTMKAMLTPDLYANSVIPMNIFLDKTITDLYLHSDTYETQSDLFGTTYTKPFTGSSFPISMFLDDSIESVDVQGTNFNQSLYTSSVQTETTPV